MPCAIAAQTSFLIATLSIEAAAIEVSTAAAASGVAEGRPDNDVDVP